MLTFGGHVFGGLSHADVSAVGHLTALLTAAAAVALIQAERARVARARTASRRASGHVTDQDADQVGDPGGTGAQEELA